MHFKHSIILLLYFIPTQLWSQPAKRMTATEYIAKYKGEAIEDMAKTGVPASITLAQGILESDAGNSNLAREANNHFGIKCHKEWTGETYIMDDDEKNECFRKYSNVLDSYDDHGFFLRNRPRYASLFELEITDYKGWAHGLKKAGYATNPKYAELLIKIIEEHELHKYDKGGSKLPISSENTAATKPAKPIENEKKHVHHKDQSGNKTDGSKEKVKKGQTGDGVPFVRATKGDTWYSIAIQHEMQLWQVLKYNDAEKNDFLKEGEIIYLKPKRGIPDQEFHVVEQGETIRDIAQKHCIKISRLIKLNGMENEIRVEAGQKLRLRR
ncbi:MAG: glucosaminidase domain-containing protein [Bacteroidota bacterium]|jgi:LysM repeat protein